MANKRLAILIGVGVMLLTVATPASAVVAAVVGVAIGVGAGALGVTAATAIAIGMAAASFVYAMTNRPPTPAQTQQELKQLVKTPRAPKSVAFGHVKTSGVLLMIEEQTDDRKNDDGTYHEWLYMIVGIVDHEINEVKQIYLNETIIEEFGDNAEYEVHNNDAGFDEYLIGKSPSYTEKMTGEGVTWLRLAMLFDRELFANGVPTPKIEYSGINQIFDFRTGETGFTNNMALVWAYLLTEHLGVSPDRIITDGFGSVIDAANLCDETVINPDGSTSKRYTVNGVFSYDEKLGDVINDVLIAGAATMVRIGGQIGLLPGAYYGPATFTLTDSDIIDDVQVQVEPAYGDSINTIKGSFVDPSQGYVETDYPPVVDEAQKAFDKTELSDSLNLRFVTDVYQAQRLADIKLKRSMAGGNITLNTNMRGLYCRLGRVINLDLKTYGIIGEYRVISYEENPLSSTGVTLGLAREDISIYNDAIGDVFVPPPFTNLPVSGVPAPTGLRFAVDAIGDVVQGIIAWQINAPQSVSTDLRIKQYATGEVIQVGSSTRDTWNVNGLIMGDYIVEARTVTMIGAVSPWASTSFIVSAPPIPDSVTVSASNWNILLTPVVTAGVADGTLFEFKYLADPHSYTTDSPTYNKGSINLAESVFTGSSFNHGGLFPDRWQHYWIRGVNIYGVSDWFYVQTGTTRDQELVTTVVERLVAIEIESGNWDEGQGLAGNYAGSRGYKLFAPDPNDPTADGRAVFNDIYARGTIHAVDGSIEKRMTVGKGYIDGTAGGNFLYTNNGAFRVTQNGDVYANDGNFRGTVHADKIIGNVSDVIELPATGSNEDNEHIIITEGGHADTYVVWEFTVTNFNEYNPMVLLISDLRNAGGEVSSVFHLTTNVTGFNTSVGQSTYSVKDVTGDNDIVTTVGHSIVYVIPTGATQVFKISAARNSYGFQKCLVQLLPKGDNIVQNN